MKKILIPLILLPAAFFGLWTGLSRIHWMSLFHLDQLSTSAEKKLGEACWNLYRQGEDEIQDEDIRRTVDSVLRRICEPNRIPMDRIKLHVLNRTDVNAFALPDYHMVIHSALIGSCADEAAFAGVLAHELAHMEKQHVTKKLIKEVGLATLISMTQSGAGGEMIHKAVKTLTSTAYDRSLEEEADLTAVTYLQKAEIETAPFASFLAGLDASTNRSQYAPEWLSTHPDSQKRARYVRDKSKTLRYSSRRILAPDSWKKLQEEVE